MFDEEGFCLFHTQTADMFGDAAAIILIGNFVKMGFADLKMAAQVGDADLFRKMRTDIFVDLDRQFFALYNSHPLQTQIGGHSLHDVGDGENVVFGNQRAGEAGGLKSSCVDAVGGAVFLYGIPAFLVAFVGKYVAEEQIADHDVAKRKRRNAFCQSGVTTIGKGVAAACGHLAGMGIAACACRCGRRVSADDAAAGRDMFRISGQLMESVVEYRDPQFGDVMKILQQGIQFGKIKGRNHNNLHADLSGGALSVFGINKL